MTTDKHFCSSCRHSKYVLDAKNQKRLFCAQRQAFGQRALIDTDSRMAEECLDYQPERMHDALTTRHNYLTTMSKCGIPASEEKLGILRNETLE